MLLVLLAGCDFFASGPRWQDQREPAGACYDFVLVDGIDTDSNGELHAIFACLNGGGLLDAFSATDAALDETTRSGTVGAVVVGTVGAAGRTRSVSAAGLLAAGLHLFDDRQNTSALLELVLELAYGAGVAELGNGVTLNSTSSLHDGLLLPMGESLAAASTPVLDDDLAASRPVAAALRSEEAPRWVWSLALAPNAPDAGIADLAANWTSTLAQLIEDTADESNNRHARASGNSLRDAATAAFAGNTLPDVVTAAGPLLVDEFARDALARWVEEEADAGRWQSLDEGLLYLASVDRQGGPVSGDEDSALIGLVRLLHDANRPLDCRIQLGVVNVEWSLGNLAVAILEVLSATDPDAAAAGVDVLGDAVGYPLTSAVLGTIADSGVCPVIDPELVADLEALDRLSDPPAEELLGTLIGLLHAADQHIGAVADLAGAVHAAELVEPVEELLVDVGGSAAADRLLAAVPGLLDPDGKQAGGSFPSGVRPVDVHSFALLLVGLTADDAWPALQPAVAVFLDEQTTWDAVGNAQRLLNRSGTATEELLPLVAEWAGGDPEMSWLPAAADYVEDPAVVGPALELLEVQALRVALLDTEVLAAGPVPWLASLYVSGTLDLLWDTVALFRPLLGEPDV